MDGIDIILNEHRRVEALFDAFTAGDTTAVGRIVDALVAHDSAEHAALYPLAGHLLGDSDAIERWAAAHSAVQHLIDEVAQQEGQALEMSVLALQQLVQTHVEDEETNLLPALREAATEGQLDGMASTMLRVHQRVG